MKLLNISILCLGMTAGMTRAATFTETFTNSVIIPEGNPIGSTLIGTVSDVTAGATIVDLTVGLNISGGYNGDLYAYLVAPNGSMVTLMDQPGTSIDGFGASGAGMDITLQDTLAAHGNLQDEISTSLLSGAYNPAGSLSAVSGSVADGDWTLFVADLGNGGGSGTLNSWSLAFTAVPEPTSAALAFFGGLAVLAGLTRRRSNRRGKRGSKE